MNSCEQYSTIHLLFAHHTTGQRIQEIRCWGKEETWIGEWADREDVRLVPQNKYLIRFWMPVSFIDGRPRSNEELKSKGRIQREMHWGRKVKGSSVLQNISKGISQPSKGVCYSLLFTDGQGQSLHELNKSTSVYSQAEGQGSPGNPLNMIIIIKASQRNNFQHGVRIGFLPATSW